MSLNQSFLDFGEVGGEESPPHLKEVGFELIPEYLTKAEEQAYIKAVDAGDWLTDLKRRVQHYGWRYDYKSRQVSDDAYLGPLPHWAEELAIRLQEDKHFATRPNQVIVNEYQIGQGIAPHTDRDCFGPVIATISLAAHRRMKLSCGDEKEEIDLYPRSLLVMKGSARTDWKHSIPPVSAQGTARRISLTFRTIERQ